MNPAEVDDIEELFAAWLDGRADAAQRARLDAHLRRDPAAVRRLLALARTQALLGDTPPVAVRRRRWPFVLAAALLAIGASVALLPLTSGARPAPTDPAPPPELAPVVDATPVGAAPPGRAPPLADVLHWDDGSQVVVAPGAAAERRDDGVRLGAGEVTAHIAPQPPGRRFRIDADFAHCAVIGTRFTATRADGIFTVQVTEGEVELLQAGGVRRLGAGDSGAAADGLIARWSGSGWRDGSWHDAAAARIGSGVGTIRAGEGPGGGALELTSEDAAVRFDHDAALDWGDPEQPFTVAAWVRCGPGPTTGERVLLSKGRNRTTPSHALALVFSLDVGDRFGVYRWSDHPAAGADRIEAAMADGAPISDGTWHHLAVVGEHAALRRFYRDGVAVGTDTTPWRNDTRNRTRWSVGRLENMGYTGESAFTGALADLRLYRRALPPAAVRTLAAR